MNLDLSKGSRERILAFIVLALMTLFIGRLFYLQIIQHDHYVALAKREQQRQFVLPAERGQIFAMDRDTPVPLVMNQTVYTVFADPSIINNTQPIIDMIQEVAGGNAKPKLDTLLNNKKSRYVILATDVTHKQAKLMKDKNLLGVGFTRGSMRVYPEGNLASQVLGFVNRADNGQYGIEGYFQERLSGVDGSLKTVADVRDVPLTVGNNNVNQPAKDGDDLVLTIDRNVQAYAERVLAQGLKKSGAKEGSVLVLDPKNSHVMAMANLPTFNPEKYNEVEDSARFQNATISQPYEPGSDIKTFTMAAGIDKGVVSPDSTFNNTDYKKVEDITITNATKGQTGVTSMQKALNYSLNTGFVTIAERLGSGDYITKDARNTMYEYFHNRLKLGEFTNIQLQGEAKGTIVSPDVEQGNAVRYSNMSFGQGMDATMLQVTAGFGAIINGGTYYPPTVVKGVLTDSGEIAEEAATGPSSDVLKRSTSVTVRNMIRDARRAFYASTDHPGYSIGGKTGTSQAIVNGKYSFDETIGTYLGFGGENSEDPSYVIMVRVSGRDQQLSGSLHAMPIFNDLSNWMLGYLKLQPKG